MEILKRKQNSTSSSSSCKMSKLNHSNRVTKCESEYRTIMRLIEENNIVLVDKRRLDNCLKDVVTFDKNFATLDKKSKRDLRKSGLSECKTCFFNETNNIIDVPDSIRNVMLLYFGRFYDSMRCVYEQTNLETTPMPSGESCVVLYNNIVEMMKHQDFDFVNKKRLQNCLKDVIHFEVHFPYLTRTEEQKHREESLAEWESVYKDESTKDIGLEKLTDTFVKLNESICEVYECKFNREFSRRLRPLQDIRTSPYIK